MLENEAGKIFPIVHLDERALQFDYCQTLKVIFEAYGLANVAKEDNVELAVTLDGSDLTKSITHVTAGFKLLDLRTRDPKIIR